MPVDNICLAMLQKYGFSPIFRENLRSYNKKVFIADGFRFAGKSTGAFFELLV